VKARMWRGMGGPSSRNRYNRLYNHLGRKPCIRVQRYNSVTPQIRPEMSDSGRRSQRVPALQNLHPRFKSGRRLQSFLMFCGFPAHSGRAIASSITKTITIRPQNVPSWTEGPLLHSVSRRPWDLGWLRLRWAFCLPRFLETVAALHVLIVGDEKGWRQLANSMTRRLPSRTSRGSPRS
jgi:hypothetical protein